MASFQKESQGYSKDLFGGVYEKNFDIFKPAETPTQSRFAHLKHLNTATPDKKSLKEENSPRRTPLQKPVDLFTNNNEPLSLSAINQRFHSLDSQQNQPPPSPSLNHANLHFNNQSNTTITQQSNSTNDQPTWFNNPKKRNVPTQVIKRENYDEVDQDSSFLISSSKSKSGSDLKSSSGNVSKGKSAFKTMSFGTRKTSSQDVNSHISSFQDELPPARTLNDLENDDGPQLDPHSNFQRQRSADSSFTQASSISANKPDSSSSNQSLKFSFQPPKHSQLDLEFQKQQSTLPSSPVNNKYTQLPDTFNESSILVFGYPESIANQVIKHFSKFGTILEDFEVVRNDTLFIQRSNIKKVQKSYPISTGNGWVKLTYDNKASSIRALEENGETFHGCLIGCVTFSKQNLDKIMKGDLDLASFKGDDEVNDEYLDFVNHFKHNKIILKTDDKIFLKKAGSGDKDKGKFLEKKSQLNWVGYINNFLFGWDDL